jgi:hypothetical protein
VKSLGRMFAAVALAACNSGEPIGKIDAMKAATVDVDLVAGERLVFRVDAEGEVGPPHDGWKRSQAIELLQRSQIVVSINGPSGASTSRCPMRGNGIVEGMSGPKLYSKGIRVDCEVAVARSGKHQVSASVVWDRAIVKPLSAVVEIRRVKK